MGAIVATGGGFAIQMYEYIQASSHFGGDAYEENIKVLLDIVSVIASTIRAMVSLVRLAYDIMKDKKQKSNRPTKV